jgi:hypothetical protein
VNKKACPNRLIIGDFNTTMSVGMDQLNYDTDPHYKCREFLTGLDSGEQFHDVFRAMYPDRRSFTWRENDGRKRSRLDVAMASPGLFHSIKDITHKAHPYTVTDHSTILITFDFNNSESGPGIFRCQPSLHTNAEYQVIIRDHIRLAIYDCLLTMDVKCDIELTILKKRQEISKRLKELSTANDPRSRAIFDNLELQLALYLCFEPTIEDLIARPMSISNATLHEFILMRLKQVTLIFSKSLKKKKTGKKPLG